MIAFGLFYDKITLWTEKTVCWISFQACDETKYTRTTRFRGHLLVFVRISHIFHSLVFERATSVVHIHLT